MMEGSRTITTLLLTATANITKSQLYSSRLTHSVSQSVSQFSIIPSIERDIYRLHKNKLLFRIIFRSRKFETSYGTHQWDNFRMKDLAPFRILWSVHCLCCGDVVVHRPGIKVTHFLSGIDRC